LPKKERKEPLLLASVFKGEIFVFILILQLFWAPFVILHSIILFLIKRRFAAPIPRNISLINTVLLIYSPIAVVIFRDITWDFDLVFVILFSVIPWLMLLYMAYIQFLILNSKDIEDETSPDVLDIE